MFEYETPLRTRVNMLGEAGVDEVLQKLASNRDTGIMGDTRDINRRKSFYGANDAP